MTGYREPNQADFDLDRFVDLLDEALTSDDPRVVETLRRLMMIVALTAPETRKEHDRRSGPLRRLFEDINHLNNRLYRMEEDLNRVARDQQQAWSRSEQYHWEDQKRYAQVSAAPQCIDDDAMKNIARQINSPGLNRVQPKGLLKK